MTISIAGYCEKTGQLGIAISSSSIAVGARCPWLLAGVGAVSSQNITLPALGPTALEQLKNGLSPEQALEAALSSDEFSDYRQVTVLNTKGKSACFSGKNTLGIHNTVMAKNCVAAGNMLHNQSVINAMTETFESSEGELTDRLIKALSAGVKNGGEAGPVHSAAVKVVDNCSWPLVDLRVDWEDVKPIEKLSLLWQDYEPQMKAYVTRALDPRDAPSYGVAGDE
ncbi:hypothetical protein MUS1_03350 [Marinomonas ushuaiensis DSM 15871]|uniref:Major pilin protein fimA n=1 Tax=Marinomonas ushuaiensis DSM 15871 TaxID=1122207 RepID=X7EBY0_9GAMM|nr:DUF1028 domain-containing protein [Marinomonas ushuaiensis]ETX12633.1 hypothetical protein MUS1_03350 [Marinomonas ushuaiensis DSM 15871]